MNDINNLDIRTHLIDAIVNVFDKMVSLEVEFFDSEPPDTTGTERMAATVNFAGSVVGLITIQVPSEMSGLMMAAMLDREADEIEDEMESDSYEEENIIFTGKITKVENDKFKSFEIKDMLLFCFRFKMYYGLFNTGK